MRQNEKDLLLTDLCGRLPYKVKAQIPDEYGGYTSIIESIDIDGFVVDFEGTQIEIECIKPYLFPLSSMTEEQKNELESMEWSFDNSRISNILEYFGTYRAYVDHSCCSELVDWLNKNKFDYRGLIPMGLAIDCTNLNIY